MKKQSAVIYSSTTEKITSVLDSAALDGCNIVGVCTNEIVSNEEKIKGIPFIQIDDIDSPVVLLDENIPDAYRKVLDDKGVSVCKLDHYLRAVNVLCSNEDAEPDEKEINVIITDNSNMCNSGISSELPVNEDNILPEQSKIYFSDEQAVEIRSCLTAWFEKIYQAINNTKNKDTSIYNINKELQKFKDGYYGKITSPIISEMITLREDYKKSIEDCSKFNLTYVKQISYLECTIDQIDEILATYDVLESDGKYSYNGKVIYPLTNNEAVEPKRFESEYPEIQKEINSLAEDANEVKDTASLTQFLTRATSNIEILLQNNEALVKSIEIQNSDLKKQISVTDGLLIIPLLRKIIRMKLSFLNKREMLENFKEEAEAIYKEAYSYGIMYSESILLSLGVSIRNSIDDTYDPKYHRILKMQKILPEESEKDKHIATFVTDCYVNEERVVAPAKVIVYKL